jgi:putative transposase
MNAAKDSYTSAELAPILSLTERAVRDRATRDAWTSIKRTGRGGGKIFPLATLPEDVRAAIGLAQAKAVEGIATPAVKTAPTDVVMPDWTWNKAKARLRLVGEWRSHTARAAQNGINMKDATEAFLLAYDAGQLLPQVRAVLGGVSMPTLYRWDKSWRENARDVESLADKRGGWANGRKKGLGQIGEDAQHIFLAAYLRPNKPSVALAYRTLETALKAQGLPVPTCSSVRRFLDRFDSLNHDLVVFHREGMKALDDKVGPFLSRNDKILQVGDVLVSDGHVMNFLVINPETGKPQRMTLVGWQDWASRMFVAFEIMPTENTQAIASSLFRAIQNLGRTPGAVYLDNGRAFDNEYFSAKADMAEHDGLYLRLGIQVLHSAPYVARTKIIERWWGDFDRQCSRLIDSYVGSSIDDKPAHMHRNERWHKERQTGLVPTLEEAKRIVAEFARLKAMQPHPTRPGTTPLEVFNAGRGVGLGEDKLAELSRHFLYRREVTPTRCRIRMLGCEFESDCLYGINKKLTAYYSYSDLSQVWIYDEGHLVGVAKPITTVHPVAALLGTEFDLNQLHGKQKEHKNLKRDTLKLATQMSAQYGPAAAQTLSALPHMQPVTERRTTFVAKPSQRPMLEAVQEISAEERNQLEAARQKSLDIARNRPSYEPRESFGSPLERYAYLFDVEVVKGIALTSEDAAWARKYELTDEYREVAALRYEKLRRMYSKTA